MPKEFRVYRANKSNTGTASAWQLSYKKDKEYDKYEMFLIMVNQSGTEENGDAKFDWKNDAITVKLGVNDLGEIMAVLEKRKDLVDSVGYWQDIPDDLDGIFSVKTDVFDGSEEDQIRRMFMAEDGRFRPMVVMERKPRGNINFNSNGKNVVMFQDIPTSSFAPNKIASGNPIYVYVACQVNQLVKRPDLALVELPATVSFDPTVPGHRIFKPWDNADLMDDEWIATKTGIASFFWHCFTKHQAFRSMIKLFADRAGHPLNDYAIYVFYQWTNKIWNSKNRFFTNENSTEVLMDLSKVIIPLTSTWSSYGPYYYTYDDAKGMVDIQVDSSLVPWNFERPPSNQPWYTNLDAAGFERLERTLADIDYLDTASITVAGFPEHGPASDFGYNSNVTGITVDFGSNGVRTTYNVSTYSARPGTYRKGEYDNVARARIDTREKLPDTDNISLVQQTYALSDRNRFPS